MRRRTLMLVAVVALAASACSNLGLGEANCDSPSSDVSSSNIMTIQAVPNAKYTPCLHELRLGWDSVNWFAEDGRAGIDIMRSFDTFLTATVTDSCDVSSAVAVESTYPDIQRFEDIQSQAVDIQVSIVPSGQDPLAWAPLLIGQLDEIQVGDRPVIYTIEDDIDQPVTTRVERALMQSEYVLIIDEVDAEEGTVQLRSNDPATSGRGLQPEDALDLIEDRLPDVFYRGSWYFTFEGGCITYEFDATGRLAETVAADAEDAIGFYPALELRQLAREQGFNLG